MLTFLPSPVRGVIALIMLTLITLALAFFTFLGAIIGLIPVKSWQRKVTEGLHRLPEYWTIGLNCILFLFTKTQWDIHGLNHLQKNGHYFMIANHRSWVDILVLQRVFSNKIPGLRFFMKQELMWQLPLISYACKLLGCPFMRRYSSEFLKKHPELKGNDIEETRKTCERFRNDPVTLINFIEGGRFTQEKHRKQNSPYKYLLRPKAGGISFVLAAMSDQVENIVDVTIIYPNMEISFWKFLCGKISKVSVFIHTIPVTPELFGDYQNDAEFRNFFQFWLNERWSEKNKFITKKLSNDHTET